MRNVEVSAPLLTMALWMLFFKSCDIGKRLQDIEFRLGQIVTRIETKEKE